MATYLIPSLPRSSRRLVRWLAVVAAILVIGGAAIPPAQAGDRPGTTGTVTTYIGQGWG